jgi:hypothetical protein
MGWDWTRTVAAAALFAVACAPSMDLPGYPLYPVAGARLPREQIARLFGPIASVDGRDVATLGNAFEVLPGCHVVLTRGDAVESTNYVAVIGHPNGRFFALTVKPGYTYIVKREIQDQLSTMYLRSDTFAEEHDAAGAQTQILQPVHKPDELAACRDDAASR